MTKWVDGGTLDGGFRIVNNHLLRKKEMADGGVDSQRKAAKAGQSFTKKFEPNLSCIPSRL